MNIQRGHKMVSELRRKVHPRYKGIAEWKVRGIAQLKKPIEYDDPIQGHVCYDPRVLRLNSPEYSKVLWFAYWISTKKTSGKIKWGGGPPMLEEAVLLELLKDAIAKNFFSKTFLRKLNHEIGVALIE